MPNLKNFTSLKYSRFFPMTNLSLIICFSLHNTSNPKRNMPVAGLFLAKLPSLEILYLSLGKKRSFRSKILFVFRTKKEPGTCLTEEKINENKELAKLKLFGAGPKMAGLGIYPTERKL